MSQHTQGPWGITTARRGSITSIIAPDGSHIAEMVHWYNATPELTEETHRNSMLIAAAPDLLDALQTMVESFTQSEVYEHQGDALDAARAVIAKVRGQS